MSNPRLICAAQIEIAWDGEGSFISVERIFLVPPSTEGESLPEKVILFEEQGHRTADPAYRYLVEIAGGKIDPDDLTELTLYLAGTIGWVNGWEVSLPPRNFKTQRPGVEAFCFYFHEMEGESQGA